MNSELNNNVIVEDQTNLSGLIKKILFHWPLYLIMIILSLVAASFYLKYKKPVYSSSAKVYIQNDKGDNAKGIEDFSFSSGSKVVNNEMELITSPIILTDVIRDNNFNIRYFQKGRLASNELYQNNFLKVNILSDSSHVGNYIFDVIIRNDNKIDIIYNDNTGKEPKTLTTYLNSPFNINKDKFSISYTPISNISSEFKIQIDSIVPLAYVKSGEIKTSITNPGGSVFQLTYEDEVPKRTADFLNAVIERYNNYTLEDKNRLALNTIKFIDTRLASLGSELGSVEREVENFKRARGITEIGQNSQLYIEQIKDADQRLNVASLQLEIYDQIERFINNPKEETALTPALGNIDQGLAGLIDRFQNLLSERRRLSLSLKPENQILINLDNQIEEVKTSIRSYVSSYRKTAITTKRNLQRTVSEIEGKIAEVPGYEREFISIKRQQGVKEGLYSYLLQKREESAVVSASNIIDNKIIAPAFIPVSPIRPNRNAVYLGFLVVGIVITTGLLFLRYSLNNSVTDKKYIKEKSNIPLIAEIFEQAPVKNTNNIVSERSLLREQMLNLRNNLRFMLNNIDKPVLLFTSSISGEGKTFLSSHLGRSLTANNKKVILLELDLRKPKLSASIGVNNNVGITNYLINAATLEEIIKPVPGTENLFVIPSGPIPPNPIELLESEKMDELFLLLKQTFSFIIVDTSPIGLVSDAKSLAKQIDCLLFVVRYNFTPKNKLLEVIEDIQASDFKKSAILFNGVDIHSPNNAYGYSNYGYGYGQGTSKPSLAALFNGLRRRIL